MDLKYLILYTEREFGVKQRNAIWVGKEREDYLQN